MKSSHAVLERLIGVVTELADVVRDLDPGRIETYRRVENALAEARAASSWAVAGSRTSGGTFRWLMGKQHRERPIS